MTRQLNLRVSDEFAEHLERVSRKVGRSMATLIEAVGTPALEAAEADAQFETEALAAWDEYQLNGKHVNTGELDALFANALARAEAVAGKQGA